MQKEERVRELMNPRYKVIADYIHSPYTVGMLVENTYSETRTERKDISWLLTQTSCHDGFSGIEKQNNYFPEQRLIELPHLFKPLSWWEERTPEEMPEYVKVVSTGEVDKVTNYFIEGKFAVYYTGATTKTKRFGKQPEPFNLRAVEPATQQEYQDYLTQKEINGK